MWIAIGIGLTLGLAMTAAGLRGRRADDHPLCRRCRFDLTGQPGDAERRCPECGADLASPRAVVVGHRRRRAGVLAGGLLVLVAALGWSGWQAWTAAAGVRWITHAPVWYLLREASSADPGRRTVGLGEVWSRYCDGRLSADAVRRVVDAGLDYQGDPAKPWDRLWGDLIESADEKGIASADQWRRYARQACLGMYTLRVRPRVRQGDPIPYELVCGPVRTSGGGPFALWCEPVNLRLVWSAAPGRLIRGPRRTFATCGEQTTLKSSFPSAGAATRPPFGPGTVRLVAEVRVGPAVRYAADYARHHGRDDPFGRSLVDDHPENLDAVRAPVAVADVDLSAPVDLLRPDQPSFRWVHDPSMAGAVRQSLRVDGVTAAGRGLAVGWSVLPPGPPVDLSFDVLVDDATGPAWVAAFATPAGPAGASAWPADVPPSTGNWRPAGGRADVTFRPDPAAAVNTVDLTDVWDAPVVVSDVPIGPGPAASDP